MPTISQNLNDIKSGVAKLRKEVTQASKETRSLSQELKFDPKNLNLVTQRFAAMRDEMAKNTEYIEKLKTSMANLEKLKVGLDTNQQSKINELIEDYRVKVEYAERAVRNLTIASTEQAEAQKLAAAAAAQAAENTRSINENLNLDPTNINLISQKFESMRQEIVANQNNVTALEAAIKKLNDLKLTLGSEADQAAINAQIDEYKTQLNAAQRAITSLSAASTKYKQAQEQVSAVVTTVTSKFETFIDMAESLQQVVLKLVNTFTNLASSITDTGTELYALALRYNTTVESIQTMNYALETATGLSDLYTTALQTMVNGMSQIASGRGVQYKKALKSIGLTYKELSNMSVAEQFEAIIEGLSQVTDAVERQQLAQTLLGESGQYIASILNGNTDALEEAIEAASEFGIISTDTATSLKELSVTLSEVKSQLQTAFANVIVAMAPVLQSLADFITDYVVPALEKFGEWFGSLSSGGQKFFLILTVILLVLPMILKSFASWVIMLKLMTTGFGTATAGATALNAATVQWQIILLAVAAVVIAIIALFALFSSSAKSALEDVENLIDASNTLAESGSDYTATTESTTTSSSEKTVNVAVTVTGEGNTSVSDETASTIAEITADEINKALGDLIK